MAEQGPVTVRPKGKIYGQGLGANCWDGDLETYNSDSIGFGSRLRTLSIDLSQIPANSVIKSVTYYICAYRTGNKDYCGLAAALGYATGTSENEQKRVTPLQAIDLTAHRTKQTTSATQAGLEEYSAQILAAQTPILWLEIYGDHKYYEIWTEITYEPDESKIYSGDAKVSAVYVGDTKASAVYVGTTKVL